MAQNQNGEYLKSSALLQIDASFWTQLSSTLCMH